MLSPVFSGEGFMIDPEIGTADDLNALIDKAASRMIGTVLEMRADMPLNDASAIDRASAAMRYWLDRGAMGIAVNTDALTASGRQARAAPGNVRPEQECFFAVS